MYKQFIITLFLLLLSQNSYSGSTLYEMRVDGLACPFCAYGIEKKLKAIKGTSNIDVDLNKGLVKVEVDDSNQLTDSQMKKLFNDSGFTYRSMKKTPQKQE